MLENGDQLNIPDSVLSVIEKENVTDDDILSLVERISSNRSMTDALKIIYKVKVLEGYGKKEALVFALEEGISIIKKAQSTFPVNLLLYLKQHLFSRKSVRGKY